MVVRLRFVFAASGSCSQAGFQLCWSCFHHRTSRRRPASRQNSCHKKYDIKKRHSHGPANGGNSHNPPPVAASLDLLFRHTFPAGSAKESRLPASQIRSDGFEWINGSINCPVTYSSQGRGRFFQKYSGSFCGNPCARNDPTPTARSKTSSLVAAEVTRL